MSYRIYLKKNEEKRIISGHSWVYANEVAKTEGKDKTARSRACILMTEGT